MGALRTRKAAAYALEEIGTPQAKRRLKPLIQGSDDDEDDDLKGLALSLNWPDNLSVDELLDALSEPRNPHYLGSYEMFFVHLAEEEFDAKGARVHGLRWAQSIIRAGHDHHSHPGQNIAAQIATAALDELKVPGVLDALVDLILEAANVHADSVFGGNRHRIHRRDRKSTGQVQSRLEMDAGLRRLLLDAILCREESRDGLWALHDQVPGLVTAEDFEWLLGRAVDEARPMAERRRFAQLAAWLPWGGEARHVDAWLSVRLREPISEVIRIPLSVRIDSEEARQARERQALQGRSQEPLPKGLLTPPPKDRVRIYLDRSEADPKWFARLAGELTLHEDSKAYKFDRFLIRTPGWASAHETSRTRIIDAARRLLSSCEDIPEACRKEDLNSILNDGGMAAIFLLLECDPNWLARRETTWWQRWTWYILRELRLALHGELVEPKAELLRLLHSHAADSFRDEIERLALDEGGRDLLPTLLRGIESIPDPELDGRLCDLLRGRRLEGPRFSFVMSFVLSRDPRRATPICVDLLDQIPSGTAESSAIRAAAALLNERPIDAWEGVMNFLRKRPDLAETVLAQFAHGRDLRKRGLSADLGPKRLGELAEVLFSVFPPESDPPHDGAYWVGERDSAVELRKTLVVQLSEQSSEGAIAALRSLEAKHGFKNPWLRRPRAEAERRHLLAEWRPIPPVAVAEILANADRRLVRSAEDVIAAISEALERYEHRLQKGSPPAIEDLWNTNRKHPPYPKDEERVSDKVCEAICDAFKGFAVCASREVQLRRRVLAKNLGGSAGSECDVLVTVPPNGTSADQQIVVVVEVKGSWNPEAKTGMRDQLVSRYLLELGITHGIFVVAYMNAPGLLKNRRPKWRTIGAARDELEKQAERIVRDHAGAVTVAAVVLDARLDAGRSSQNTPKEKSLKRAKRGRKETTADKARVRGSRRAAPLSPPARHKDGPKKKRPKRSK